MALNTQLNEIATMAAVVLALLTLFTGQRARQYSEDLSAGLGKLSGHARLQLLGDLGLATITFAACAAMWPLFSASASASHWADRSHALRSLFIVMYLGFALLVSYQFSLAGRRIAKHIKNWRAANTHVGNSTPNNAE
jgi:hypothetical protein